MSKLTRLFVLGAQTIGMSWAQDPITVEPTHYKLDFENGHVQVVYVYYAPHEKSNLHAHPAGRDRKPYGPPPSVQ